MFGTIQKSTDKFTFSYILHCLGKGCWRKYQTPNIKHQISKLSKTLENKLKVLNLFKQRYHNFQTSQKQSKQTPNTTPITSFCSKNKSTNNSKNNKPANKLQYVLICLKHNRNLFETNPDMLLSCVFIVPFSKNRNNNSCV